MRFTVNLHSVRNDNDSVNDKFPLNTFVTEHPESVLRELNKLFANDMSGINKIVIFDESMGKLSESDIGMSKIDVDQDS